MILKIIFIISSGNIKANERLFIRYIVQMQFSSSELLLPQYTNDKHLWTMAAICWVFQSILSWNWLALYEKCTENYHAIKANQAIPCLFFFCTPAAMNIFWWIHWDVLKNIHIGLHIMQFILILLTVCKQTSNKHATVYSSRTLGSDFGSNECMRKGLQLKRRCEAFLLTLLWKIILTVV